MNDDTLNSILRRVILEPDVDLHRLVYADRLDELGGSDRAEFVRVQVEVAKLHTCECAPSLFVVPDCPVCEVVKPFRYRQNTLLTGVCDEYRPKTDYSWAVVSGQGGTSDGPISWVWRGFVESIELDAETFLRHADALIWHETQTVVCERCDGDGKAHGADRPFEWSADPEYMKCPVCKGSGRGGLRPCPPTAQPIRKVTLTTLGEDEVAFLVNNNFTTTTGVTPTTGTSPKWPGVEFELPTVGTEAASEGPDEEEWNDHEVWGMRRVQ